MSTLHRIDFFRAALQVRGASPVEIEHILAGLRKMGGAKFDAWNRPMTAQELSVYAMLSGPHGPALAVELLDGLKKKAVSHYGISDEEIARALKPWTGAVN